MSHPAEATPPPAGDPGALRALGRLGFIGVGRLGQTVARALHRAGLPVGALHSRRREATDALKPHLPDVAVVDHPQAVAEACDTVFLTVSDDAIAAVCAGVSWRAGQHVVHASGATDVAALQSAEAAGALTGGWHPLHTFGTPDVALAGLPGCAVAVEAADGTLRDGLHALAQRLGCRPFALPPGSRALYHAGAHYAGSFVIALMAEAAHLWSQFGVDRDTTLAALRPLLRSTVAAIENDGLARGMAGCIARGDAGTLQAHLQALQHQAPEALALYAELSRRNVPLAMEKGTVDATRAAALRALLAQASDSGGSQR